MTSPGFPAHCERLLVPPKNCTFAWLIADSKSIRPALNATHLANSLCCLPASSKPQFPPLQLTLPSLPFSLFPTLAPSQVRLFPVNPPFFISACSHLSPSNFPTRRCSHSFGSYFISPSSFSPSHFHFLLTSLLTPTLVASSFFFVFSTHFFLGWMCKWGSLHDCHKTQDIKLSNTE